VDWPEEYKCIPYYFLAGGLCFDITEYINKFEKTAFLNTLYQDVLLGRSRERNANILKLSSMLTREDIKEILAFHMYIRHMEIFSRLLYYYEDITLKAGKQWGTFQTFRQWKNYIAENLTPYQIYLDVTDLTLDDIALYWGDIVIAKEYVGAMEGPFIGNRRGLKRRREISRSMTWQEIRNYLRENPRDVGRLEHQYVNERGKLDREERRKAIQNFYKSVIVHPDMKDLGLRIRRRGRPRKSRNQPF